MRVGRIDHANPTIALLQTRADDHYIVNGREIWTSQAELADWIFCLHRTNFKAKTYEGIIFFLSDITAPEVRASRSGDPKRIVVEMAEIVANMAFANGRSLLFCTFKAEKKAGTTASLF